MERNEDNKLEAIRQYVDNFDFEQFIGTQQRINAEEVAACGYLVSMQAWMAIPYKEDAAFVSDFLKTRPPSWREIVALATYAQHHHLSLLEAGLIAYVGDPEILLSREGWDFLRGSGCPSSMRAVRVAEDTPCEF